MYARIENNQIAEYPLGEVDIRSRFPNTSFTTDFASGLPDGYVKVFGGSVPDATDLQVSEETTPVFTDGMWVRSYVMRDKFTAEELAQKAVRGTEAKWVEMRAERDERIHVSTWIVERHAEQKALGVATTISDTEHQLWLEYRQKLRNLPSTITNINNIQWPSAPGQLGIAGV